MKNDSKLERWLVRGAIAVALSSALAACGKTADVLTSHGDAGNGGSSGDDASVEGAGGNGSGSTGGAGNGGASGKGSAGSSGAGFTLLPDGGVVLAPDGGTPNDPHAEERRSLAEQFCDLTDKYPCLNVGPLGPTPPGFSPRDTCIAAMNLNGFVASCWDEWAAAMKCLIAGPHQCPCTGGDCYVYQPGQDPSNPANPRCATAFMDCRYRVLTETPGLKTVTGTRYSCVFDPTPDQPTCTITCGNAATASTPELDFSTSCQGAPGGPYDCTSSLNGVVLVDDATDLRAEFYAHDCLSTAKALADGKDGLSDVDCCFNWHQSPDAGGAGDHCSCTADPTQAGFASCAAAAAGGHGEVVNVCSQYVVWTGNPGGFPAP